MRRARIAVERGRRRGVEVAREPPRGIRRDVATRPGRGTADEIIDLVVGDERGQAGAAREGERAGRRQRELPRNDRLGIVAGRVLRLPLARHDDGETVGLRGRPEAAQHLRGHVDHLAHCLPGDLDLGEADGRG